MAPGSSARPALVALLVTVMLPGAAPPAHAVDVPTTRTFTNGGTITMAPLDSATPYPSTVAVSGFTGGITDVRVTLSDIDHMFPDRLQAVLVAPNGDAFQVVDRVGGPNQVSDITLTFADSAPDFAPDSTLASGTYKPTTYYLGNHPLEAPGPSSYAEPGPLEGNTATFASVFGGDDPNGTWSLYVADWGGGGTITAGWSLSVTAPAPAPPVPNTTFTKKPAKKVFTTTSKKKVTFGFTSSVAGSTFVCKVDAKAAKPCSSPWRFKAGLGKHKVTVTARAGGVSDPSPATYRFKVKRKPAK
jgi:subtilisin-like proprotein convertase family protein